MKHAYEYGQSRVICGYHYQSDVDAGRRSVPALVMLPSTHQKGSKNKWPKAKKEIAKILTANKK